MHLSNYYILYNYVVLVYNNGFSSILDQGVGKNFLKSIDILSIPDHAYNNMTFLNFFLFLNFFSNDEERQCRAGKREVL